MTVKELNEVEATSPSDELSPDLAANGTPSKGIKYELFLLFDLF